MSDSYRQVRLRRTGAGAFEIANDRGGTLSVGSDEQDFTPVELFLAALAGCASVNVEEITGRRATPERFEVTASGDKVRDEGGGRLDRLRLVFDLEYPTDEGGDAAREILPRVLAQTRDRICTVSRTVHLGADVDYVADESPEPGEA